MPINPLNHHYAMENPASVYDEEAMTALELAGRTTAKVNETVKAFNELETKTGEHLGTQDQAIERIRKVTVPAEVKAECERLISAGEFDQAISVYMNHLNERVDNLLGSVEEGSTTLDAEVIDARVNANGVAETNAGSAVRSVYTGLSRRIGKASIYLLDMVRENLGNEELMSFDLECGHTDPSKSWVNTTKTITLPVGYYTVLVEDMKLPDNLEAGYGIEIVNAIRGIREPGVYEITAVGSEVRNVILQVSTGTLTEAGNYFARGIHIFKGRFTDKPGIPEYFCGADKKLPITLGKNLFNPAEAVHGFYLSPGGVSVPERPEWPGQSHSGFMPVEPGENYVCNHNRSGGSLCFYDADKLPIEGHPMQDYNKGGYMTAPANARYLAVSYVDADEATLQVEKGTASTAYEPFTQYAPLYELEKRIIQLETAGGNIHTNEPGVVKSDNLSAGTKLELPVPNLKNGYSMSARVELSGSLSGHLYLYHGKTTPYASGCIDVDATNVSVLGYGSAQSTVLQKAHGLTISQFIIINATVREFKKLQVELVTLGGTYSFEYTPYNGSYGPITLVCDQALSNVEVCYRHNDYPLWCFGDSYFDYWPQYVVEKGFTNWLADSYSGRYSLSGVESFSRLLESGTTKKAVWFMGMNDADSSTAVNANWLSAVQTFIRECETHNITPILSTIPSTPTRNNSFKNEWVKNSGYRYIDVAKAVGAHKSTSWYSGYLGSDNTHPTQTGAKVIANYILAMLPEIKEV